MFIDLHHDL